MNEEEIWKVDSNFFCILFSLQLSTPFDTAVDVGCGSGKSTEALSPYFKNVIGLDRRDVKNNYAYKSGGLYNIIYRLVILIFFESMI